MSGSHESDGGNVAALIKQLGHLDRLQRVHAAAQLVRLGRQDEGLVAVIQAALKDGPDLVQKMAALVLGDLAPLSRQAIPALIDAVGDADEGLRRRAVVALGRFGPEAVAAVPALQSALNDPDEGVRCFAATALALIAPEKGAA
jgi:hypothetical protein